MSKILLIIAQEGYQAKEYEDTKKALTSYGHEVITASNDEGVAISNIGSHTKIDISLPDVIPDDYDAIYLIGGSGALQYLDNTIVWNIIWNLYKDTNKPFGAICISPRILINANVMKGVSMTGWNDDGELEVICNEAGAIYVMDPVVKDGRVITADGPMSAYDFGKKISEQFN